MKKRINIKVTMFRLEQNARTMVLNDIPVADIITYVNDKYNMKIPEKYFPLLLIPSNNNKSTPYIYKILPLNESLYKYSFLHIKELVLLMYPPTVNLRIHTYNDQFETFDFNSKLSSQEMLKIICPALNYHDTAAYNLYLDPHFHILLTSNKALVETDPSRNDLYLYRKYWTKNIIEYSNNNEKDFMYFQSIEMVENTKFQVREYGRNERQEISVLYIVEKVHLKAIYPPIKKTSPIPKWMQKKSISKFINNNLDKYSAITFDVRRDIFINILSNNEYFGSQMWTVKCILPISKSLKESEYTLVLSQNFLSFYKKRLKVCKYKLPIPEIIRWKVLDETFILTILNTKNVNIPNDLTVINIKSRDIMAIYSNITIYINYLTNLITKESEKTPNKSKYTQRKGTFILDKIMPPKSQDPIECDLQCVIAKRESNNMTKDFEMFYNIDDIVKPEKFVKTNYLVGKKRSSVRSSSLIIGKLKDDTPQISEIKENDNTLNHRTVSQMMNMYHNENNLLIDKNNLTDDANVNDHSILQSNTDDLIIDIENITVRYKEYGSLNTHLFLLPINSKIPDLLAFLKENNISKELSDLSDYKLLFGSRKRGFAEHLLNTDFSEYMNYNKFSIVAFPNHYKLKIHCSDEYITTRVFQWNSTPLDIIESICNKTLHINQRYCFALYWNDSDSVKAFPMERPISEINPFASEVWLRRRYWISSMLQYNTENDIQFNYIQAKYIFYHRYSSDLYDVSPHLSVMKTINSLMQEIFILPKWFIPSNIPIEILNERNLLSMKKRFIELCIEDKFFGSLVCDIECKVNDLPANIITFTEDLIILKFNNEFVDGQSYKDVKKCELYGTETLIIEFETSLMWKIRSKYTSVISEHIKFYIKYL
ncbi:hypothetical protein TRFO_06598 [Tritrichomonas foetus]|uniref:Uncharacterized protein n=1 Tax=Tritrichomonas foetus TaxID=1144522 RepID=A0A1J4JXN9_9EUKA|nr:hypothetical protein TRFO_06598 [Tritrichomonas foetus]|eukprot:OHT03755.1 hypothetical protein TRFO_06598 [Tritrichomonas foetus]